MPFYAVRKGEKPGIYKTWPECQDQIKSYKGAQYKKFPTVEEAEKFLGFDLAKTMKDEIAKLKEEAAKEEPPAKGKESPAKRKVEEEKSDDEDSSPSKAVKLDVVPEAVLEKAKKLTKKDYPTTEDGYVICYTDGCCFMNGRKGACAGLGVSFGPEHQMNISEPVDGKQTNNRAEILAVVYAIAALKASGVDKIEVRMDSEFTIKCVEQWLPGWKKKGWKTSAGADVKNKEELQILDAVAKGVDVRYSHVAAHSGNSGNEAADKLAKEGAKKTHS